MNLAFGCLPSCLGVTGGLWAHSLPSTRVWEGKPGLELLLWPDSRGVKAQRELNNLQLNLQGFWAAREGSITFLWKKQVGLCAACVPSPMAPCLIWSQRALCRTKGNREPWPGGFSGILNLAGPLPCPMSSTWLAKWQSIKSWGWSRGGSWCWCFSGWEGRLARAGMVLQPWGPRERGQRGQSSHTVLAQLYKGSVLLSHLSHQPWWGTGCHCTHSCLLQLQIFGTNSKTKTWNCWELEQEPLLPKACLSSWLLG